MQHVRCGSRRRAKCKSCSYLAQGDYRRLLNAGYEELEASMDEYVFFLLTLTAPSFGAVHRVPKEGRSKKRCRCGKYHWAKKDGRLRGVAVDVDEYRFDEVVEWNHNVGKLWNATNTKLKKLLPSMDYVKVSEWQRRGALHLHVILRIPRQEWHLASAQKEAENTSLRREIRKLIMSIVVEDRWVWGDKALDLQEIETEGDRGKAAFYLAKALAYVTKDVAGESGEVVGIEAREHFELLDCAARDMGCDSCDGGAFACGKLCHRRWGARSSTMSKSRGGKDRIGWCSLRKMDLLNARRQYAQRMASLEQAEQRLEEVLGEEDQYLFGVESLVVKLSG
ncbi:replication initiator [Corynebacterium auriscanis]|uniref:replication initiator n=1 Tax=Corynebacterium auriscanis TaxID=99807 RepID=UPI003CEDE6E2